MRAITKMWLIAFAVGCGEVRSDDVGGVSETPVRSLTPMQTPMPTPTPTPMPTLSRRCRCRRRRRCRCRR